MEQVFTHSKAQLTIDEAVLKGSQLAEKISSHGLEISEKSVVLASSKFIATSIVRALNCKGIPAKAAPQSEDLGISTSAGRRRAVASVNKRIARGKSRAKRFYLAGAKKLTNW